MEIDGDLDQGFLQQFSCLGTTDKEELIKQLQSLVNEQLNYTSAAFFLEMNNWNLQAAVCSYFDINATLKLPSMLFVQDSEISDKTSVPPDTKVVKYLKIKNNGDEVWPSDCSLQFSGGICLSVRNRIPVTPLEPGCYAHLSLEMTSPKLPGIYQSKWRMCTSSGCYFGDAIWVILTVTDNNVVNGLVQQFSHLSDLGSQPNSHVTQNNPFSRSSHTYQDSMQSTQDNDNNTMC